MANINIMDCVPMMMNNQRRFKALCGYGVIKLYLSELKVLFVVINIIIMLDIKLIHNGTVITG